jgi:hypothetical protein
MSTRPSAVLAISTQALVLQKLDLAHSGSEVTGLFVTAGP